MVITILVVLLIVVGLSSSCDENVNASEVRQKSEICSKSALVVLKLLNVGGRLKLTPMSLLHGRSENGQVRERYVDQLKWMRRNVSRPSVRRSVDDRQLTFVKFSIVQFMAVMPKPLK